LSGKWTRVRKTNYNCSENELNNPESGHI
jgi:hypothetical protein